MLELKSGNNKLGIYPALGGAIAYWLKDNLSVFYPIQNSHLTKHSNQIIAGYPLLPYSNRIANSSFVFQNKEYHIESNASNGQDAIHGNAWQREWELEVLTENSVTLSLEYDPLKESIMQWPFAYRAKITYVLSRNGLSIYIAYKNIDTQVQPVGLGFHPYFPHHNGVEVGFTAKTVWNNGKDGLPEGRMSIDGQWDFSSMRPIIQDKLLDNCYAGWDNVAFIRWPYQNAYLTMISSKNFQHLVLFTPPNQPYFTLEPATNMNNAVNMLDISDRGLVTVNPGQVVKGYICYSFVGI